MGHALTLTIESRLQQYAYEALSRSGFSGTIVISDPSTGALLAMVSYPSFDPNLFVPSISPAHWKQLSHDPKKPILNRATVTTSPGSTAKIITALAAEYKGLDLSLIHI